MMHNAHIIILELTSFCGALIDISIVLLYNKKVEINFFLAVCAEVWGLVTTFLACVTPTWSPLNLLLPLAHTTHIFNIHLRLDIQRVVRIHKLYRATAFCVGELKNGRILMAIFIWSKECY